MIDGGRADGDLVDSRVDDPGIGLLAEVRERALVEDEGDDLAFSGREVDLVEGTEQARRLRRGLGIGDVEFGNGGASDSARIRHFDADRNSGVALEGRILPGNADPEIGTVCDDAAESKRRIG